MTGANKSKGSEPPSKSSTTTDEDLAKDAEGLSCAYFMKINFTTKELLQMMQKVFPNCAHLIKIG
jgi:hypothetical protein